MKINLPIEAMEEVIKSLEIKNQAHTRFNGQDYYFKKERFSFESGTTPDFSDTLNALDKKVEKIIQHEARSENFVFATIGRVREQQNNSESGKVVYIYFFSNNKFDTVFPDELVSQYELHTWIKRV
ncbi:hypothetical protein [Domibacillus tundrae]|uniref:hypothetical protein n=1 Tax=Domibacillus tundrae TaxID=1587527 RepID=UPI0033989BD6